jgi:hypothetical protein
MDSHSHLFFDCSFSKELWMAIIDRVAWRSFPCSWDDIVVAISDVSTAPKSLMHKLLLSAAVYNIWQERNQRLFTTERRLASQLVSHIMDTIMGRVAWKKKRRVLPFNVGVS